MDTENLIEHARWRFSHEAAKRLLREKYQTRLVVYHKGGAFRASPEIIVFLTLYGDQDIVLQDLYQNPVSVKASELCDLLQQRWHPE